MDWTDQEIANLKDEVCHLLGLSSTIPALGAQVESVVDTKMQQKLAAYEIAIVKAKQKADDTAFETQTF